MEDLEKYPLHALKEIYQNEYGEYKPDAAMLDDVMPEMSKDTPTLGARL